MPKSSLNLDSEFVFKPLFCMGEYETKTEDMRISVAILMPSGICERKADHDVKVTDNGLALEVSVVWPPCMSDMLYLHKKWIDNDPAFVDNVRLAGFRSFFRRLRTSSADTLVSSYKIKLPFAVKTEITIVKKNRFYLSWAKSNQRVLYVTLEAHDSERNVEEDAIPTFEVL
eukprot:IDg3925t1